MLSMRRRLLAVAMLLAICMSTAGLFSINAANAQRARARKASNVGKEFSSDPNQRMLEMLNENENRGHRTPVRIHGGVGP
jgi:hypothetical protein